MIGRDDILRRGWMFRGGSRAPRGTPRPNVRTSTGLHTLQPDLSNLEISCFSWFSATPYIHCTYTVTTKNLRLCATSVWHLGNAPGGAKTNKRNEKDPSKRTPKFTYLPYRQVPQVRGLNFQNFAQIIGFSLVFHWFTLIFIDFHWFLVIFDDFPWGRCSSLDLPPTRTSCHPPSQIVPGVKQAKHKLSGGHWGIKKHPAVAEWRLYEILEKVSFFIKKVDFITSASKSQTSVQSIPSSQIIHAWNSMKINAQNKINNNAGKRTRST